MNLAIIPARGGSQRIYRKNIRKFLGKPIIEYSIESALKSKCFDEIIVSTDDDEISEIAMACGANVPFKRSILNSSNTSTTIDVLLEVLNSYKLIERQWKNICCIYPAAPFITPDLLNKGKFLLDNNLEVKSVIPVVKYSHPIQRALKIQDGYLSFINKDFTNMRTQDLESSYHDAGQFYWLDTEAFLNTSKIFNYNSMGLIIEESKVQDIDNEEDWILAELKYKLQNRV
jgi:pseudaminic acid cytidylyltransferase